MSIPELVQRKASRQLDDFVQRQNAEGRGGDGGLTWQQEEEALLLLLRPDPGASSPPLPLARFCFNTELRQWTLHYRDDQERWRLYLNVGATLDFGKLLQAVERDPFGFFWPEPDPFPS